MDNDITLNELTNAKFKLDQELQQSISVLLTKFSNTTGVHPSSVSVNIQEIHTLAGRQRQFGLVGVKTTLEV